MIELKVSSDIKQIIDKFKDELSDKQIRAILANSINASFTQYKKRFNEESLKTYNVKNKVMNKTYFANRANANSGKIEGRIGYRSMPVSMSEFVTNKSGQPTVFIKSQKYVKGGFFVKTFGANVFKRDDEKVAPTKGKYAGKIATKGERKGRLILRQKIEKRYTLTTAQFANQVSGIAMSDPLLLKIFENKLEEKLKKLSK